MDAETTVEEIKREIANLVGRDTDKEIKVQELRPIQGGGRKTTIEGSRSLIEQLVRAKRIKIGFNNCSITKRISIDTCHKCLEAGHIAVDCKRPDRSKGCYRCGSPEHLAKECKEEAKRCFTCNTTDHRTGTTRCPTFGDLLKERRAAEALSNYKAQQ